jgi:hypothetical protein
MRIGYTLMSEQSSPHDLVHYAGEAEVAGFDFAVNADLPGPLGFDAASQFVRPEDVAESIPCGPDLDRIAEAVLEWRDAGFTDIALVQIGDEGQQDLLDMAGSELLPHLELALS